MTELLASATARAARHSNDRDDDNSILHSQSSNPIRTCGRAPLEHDRKGPNFDYRFAQTGSLQMVPHTPCIWLRSCRPSSAPSSRLPPSPPPGIGHAFGRLTKDSCEPNMNFAGRVDEARRAGDAAILDNVRDRLYGTTPGIMAERGERSLAACGLDARTANDWRGRAPDRRQMDLTKTGAERLAAPSRLLFLYQHPWAGTSSLAATAPNVPTAFCG